MALFRIKKLFIGRGRIVGTGHWAVAFIPTCLCNPSKKELLGLDFRDQATKAACDFTVVEIDTRRYLFFVF